MELHAVYRLRQEVFVVEQGCPYLDADDKDPECHHLFASAPQGGCLACLRLVPPGLSYAEASLGRVATHLSVRGQGLGYEVMRRGLNAAMELFGSTSVRISAQCYLMRFYESFGFKIVGDMYLEDEIPHIEMVWMQ